jgi:hypothetical protein
MRYLKPLVVLFVIAVMLLPSATAVYADHSEFNNRNPNAQSPQVCPRRKVTGPNIAPIINGISTLPIGRTMRIIRFTRSSGERTALNKWLTAKAAANQLDFTHQIGQYSPGR